MDTPSNEWIRLFQPHQLLTCVYNWAHSHAIFIDKSIRKMYALLELCWSTVHVIIVKWKRLGATMAQVRNGRPQKLTERDRRVLKRMLTTEFQNASGSNVRSFTKWVSMAEHPHPSLRSPCAIPSLGWSGVKLATIGLWSSGKAFSGVMNHASPCGSPTDESGLDRFQENATCPNA